MVPGDQKSNKSLVGPGGRRLQYVRDHSRAIVSVSEEDENIYIYGMPNNVAKAKEMIHKIQNDLEEIDTEHMF
eukprot:TRINITY_DN4811_c0_g1_i1.p2 TRINITY_DN4811_c0_g1~~TRINITY_DN4811_c0_g1_i1.p2  ORF type:complete len:73 (-),score=6.38 TRINITY_DN4811_c0_g1_i1:148-366(-)